MEQQFQMLKKPDFNKIIESTLTRSPAPYMYRFIFDRFRLYFNPNIKMQIETNPSQL